MGNLEAFPSRSIDETLFESKCSGSGSGDVAGSHDTLGPRIIHFFDWKHSREEKTGPPTQDQLGRNSDLTAGVLDERWSVFRVPWLLIIVGVLILEIFNTAVHEIISDKRNHNDMSLKNTRVWICARSGQRRTRFATRDYSGVGD